MKSRFFRRGFTLAEIMIVLMVIGIISAILLPVARHATPDENVLKFKKANATLGNVIRELVTSDKYYLDGDLGTRADGTLMDGSHTGDNQYLCQTISDMLNVKKSNCTEFDDGPRAMFSWTEESDLEDLKGDVDDKCKDGQDEGKSAVQIITQDGVIWHEASSKHPFGVPCACHSIPEPLFKHNAEGTYGILGNYKVFCLDIDGFNTGEDPFGYGIRADGKILYGARAEEWIQKSIQNKD